MGGKSTSQSALSSDKGENVVGGFDLRSWQGLTEVLRAGKEALKDAHAYGDFRNLVLEYAQKGGDEGVRKKIEAVMRGFGGEGRAPASVPVHTPSPTRDASPKKETQRPDTSPSVPTPEASTHNNTIDTVPRRMTPTFVAYSGTEPVPVATRPIAKVVPVTPSVREPDRVKTIPVSSADTPPMQKLPVPEVSPTPVHTPPPVAVRAEPEQTPAANRSIEAYKVRIGEIKRAVHDRIGNPAALIDTHNDIGKTYMQALLTALKATSAGSPIGIETAMKALEQAYETIITHVGKSEAAPEASVPTRPPVAEVSSQRAEQKEEVKMSAVEEKKEEVPRATPAASPKPIPRAEESDRIPFVARIPTPVAPPVPISVPVPTDRDVPRAPIARVVPQQPAPAPKPIAPTPKPPIQNIPRVQPPSVPKPTPQPPVTLPVAKPSQTERVTPLRSEAAPVAPRPIVKEIPVPSRTAVVTPAPPAPQPAVAPKPVSAEARTSASTPQEARPDPQSVRLPERPRPAQSPDTVVHQSELSTAEVTGALVSLLNEWSLFKGSGILGMGPAGIEHPLYKKLANLSMGEVLAGRWERPDPKVVRTIKEYVDAWRHEQGIAYTINETFEHYLRRVVQRILKRRGG